MAFEIEEVDVEDEDPMLNLHILSLMTGVSIPAIMQERKRLQAAEEFWSDPVWVIPLKDDIYGYVCHPPISTQQTLERAESTENNR